MTKKKNINNNIIHSNKGSLEISMLGKDEFTDAELEQILNQGEVKATEKPPLPPQILWVGDCTLATFGNFSASTGKAKSKKTFNLSAMVAASIINGTVLKRKVVGIAEQLLATEMTTHELNVLRVPGKVLAVNLRIVDRHILTLPERVLRRDMCIVHLYILTILEDVLSIRSQAVNIDMVGMHEGIGALMKRHILDLHVMNMPECLIGIVDLDVL